MKNTTFSTTPGECFPVITAAEFAEFQQLRAVNAELVAALQALFEHCAMTHKHWGEGCNRREAEAAQADARAVLSKAGA